MQGAGCGVTSFAFAPCFSALRFLSAMDIGLILVGARHRARATS